MEKKMEKNFDTVYQTLLELKLDENVLCQEFWRKLMKLRANFNKADCWELIVENIEWLFHSGALEIAIFKSWFTEAELNEHGIYTKGHVKAVNEWIVGLGNVKIAASGHSKVVLFENAHCEGFDSTFIKGFGNSTFIANECVGEAFQNCKCTAGFQSKIEAWDDVIVEAKDYSMVIKHDNASGIVSSRAFSIIQ